MSMVCACTCHDETETCDVCIDPSADACDSVSPVLYVSSADFDRLLEELDKPARAVPVLQRLFEKSRSVFK